MNRAITPPPRKNDCQNVETVAFGRPKRLETRKAQPLGRAFLFLLYISGIAFWAHQSGHL